MQRSGHEFLRLGKRAYDVRSVRERIGELVDHCLQRRTVHDAEGGRRPRNFSYLVLIEILKKLRSSILSKHDQKCCSSLRPAQSAPVAPRPPLESSHPRRISIEA